MDSLKIKRINNTNADFTNLIFQLDNELTGRYESKQKDYDNLNKIELIDTVILIYDNKKAIGCGCFKRYNKNSAEIKRMFVKADYRGKGISKIIIKELENWASEVGFSKLVLETGKKQPEAIGLYENFGFKRIENYGQYADLPNSICFEKILIK
jgi:putative acetyltransferase